MPSKTRQKKKQKGPVRPKSRLKKIYNYFFLVFLGLLVSVSFLPIGPYKQLDKYLWNIPVIVTGILLIGFFFFLNRKRVSVVLSESCEPQNDSSGRFLLKAGLIVVTAFLVFSYRLGGLDFWDDEYLVMKAAEGIHQTGTYFLWDFIKEKPSKREYTRAWPHTRLVAQSYRILGVSEWSTRIVSVLFGCIFIGISFFVTYFFTGDKFFSYLVAVVFLLNPDFIYYWRQSRMYALLLPLFLILPVFVFKAIDGKPAKEGRQNKSLLSIREYLNLDYVYLGLSIFVLYWAYQIHITPLIIFPIAFVYVMLIALIRRERKYIGLTVIGIVSGLAGYMLLPQHIIEDFAGMAGFFQSFNLLYFKLAVQRPFFSIANLVLLSGIIFIIPLTTHKSQQKKLLYCLSIVLTSLGFYVFMVDFYGRHYRYMCHIIPFAILVICMVYMVILKVYNNKYILIVGVILLVASQTGHFIRGMKGLYYGFQKQPYPSIAYATVRENLREGDVIFAQYLRDYYMKGIPANTRIIDLGKVKQGTTGTNPYHFDQFFKDIRTYKQGWVVWQKYKEHHVEPKVAAYVKTLFKKYHGQGIDDTGVEVYYFNESMIKIPNFK